MKIYCLMCFITFCCYPHAAKPPICGRPCRNVLCYLLLSVDIFHIQWSRYLFAFLVVGLFLRFGHYCHLFLLFFK
ncbi:hypothetical protein IHE45_12G075800 [Dioscorea alata]|uniref:Uncharacterized protein n=1 Tax=Dioscorea alata TaxID=55571 RepID=A0ACB7V3A8_DIOAL|nr:hypothetical protein IHE45_12G075800 [Dioscorea alata]